MTEQIHSPKTKHHQQDSEGPEARDRVDRLLLKGAERLQRLIDDSGGAASTAWVAQFLGITEAAVRKRAQRHTLIVLRTRTGELSYPRFQFAEHNRGLINGMPRLLNKTRSWPREEVIRFLLVPYQPDAAEVTPLLLLQQGALDRVLRLLEVHGHQRP